MQGHVCYFTVVVAYGQTTGYRVGPILKGSHIVCTSVGAWLGVWLEIKLWMMQTWLFHGYFSGIASVIGYGYTYGYPVSCIHHVCHTSYLSLLYPQSVGVVCSAAKFRGMVRGEIVKKNYCYVIFDDVNHTKTTIQDIRYFSFRVM